MAVAGAGAGAEVMAKVGAGAKINNFGSATLVESIHISLFRSCSFCYKIHF